VLLAEQGDDGIGVRRVAVPCGDELVANEQRDGLIVAPPRTADSGAQLGSSR
jgi:hypothetical protein